MYRDTNFMSMRRTHKPDRAARESTHLQSAVVIPTRDAVLASLARAAKPLSLEELARGLGVHSEAERAAFTRRLRAMARDGQVLRNRRGLYCLVDKMQLVRGRVVGHADGYGFVAAEGGGSDLYLPPREMRQVLHGDRIVACVTAVDARGRQEGAIVEVLERHNKTVVGRYLVQHRIGVVVPEDRRINQEVLIAGGDEGAARSGQMVVAEIIDQPTRHTQPAGRITEVLGEPMAPGMEIEVAIRQYGLPHVWLPEAVAEAGALGREVDRQALRGREELRKLPLVTIDGEDARDFDDAVYAERVGKDWRLIVAIADVAHYVRPGSALDREAFERGNSVYFPDRVIPMLPEALSNGLCSLNPQVDRLCLACEMRIGPRGKIKRFRFFNGVMRSHARLTYTAVAAMLIDRDAKLLRRYADLVPHLQELYALFQALHRVRMQRGAVDFELPETRFIFDEQRKIRKIVPLERNAAHRLIEECMLAANVSAAELLRQHEIPIPYRIHERPSAEKLAEVREFLAELGLSLGGGGNPQPKDYAALLASVAERPDSRLIQMALLRSLSQAMYSPDNIGHFALGYEHYVHFTSPIRRYPDLLVHRAIKEISKARRVRLALSQAQAIGEHCSMTERRADEATRDVARWLKAEYMMDRVGDEFDGIITGVTNFGVFVELTEVYVDGLVHVTALGNDYFQFDPAKHRLMGTRTRASYHLGDHVRVRVVRVDPEEGRIDLEPVSPSSRQSRRGPWRRRRS
jgi:ribonuclease R